MTQFVVREQADGAGAGGQEAHDGLQQRALAHAVLAEHRQHLASRDVKRDIPQHHRLTIAGNQAVDLQSVHAAVATAWGSPV